MIDEAKRIKEMKEEQKIMEGIHMKNITIRNNREMKEQQRKLKEYEEEKYCNKMLKMIFGTAIIGIMLEIVGLAIGL